MNTTTYMLMRMCARGSRQLELINEIVENRGVVKLHLYNHPVAGRPGLHTSVVTGNVHLPSSSWRGLRKRLVEAGFTCKRDMNKMELIVGLGAHSV